MTNQPGRPTKKIWVRPVSTSPVQTPIVSSHARPAAQLNEMPRAVAKLERSPSFGSTQKSMKITAPIGMRIIPQSATKSSRRIVTMGNMAVTLAMRPVTSVTLNRED